MTTTSPDGPGGALRHEAEFHDTDGNPVPQGDPKAATVEITSYDADGNEVGRTYATI